MQSNLNDFESRVAQLDFIFYCPMPSTLSPTTLSFKSAQIFCGCNKRPVDRIHLCPRIHIFVYQQILKISAELSYHLVGSILKNVSTET